jgi:hypothetical protein
MSVFIIFSSISYGERGSTVINPLAPELFFFNFSTPCISNVNNTGTKQVGIMKLTAF